MTSPTALSRERKLKVMASSGADVLAPRQGTQLRRILNLLPATNADIAEELCTHSGDVARTMWDLAQKGLVSNDHPGRGRRAFYRLTEAGEKAMAAPSFTRASLSRAAPDMLAALRMARNHVGNCHCGPFSGCGSAAARAAIDAAVAKAEGL